MMQAFRDRVRVAMSKLTANLRVTVALFFVVLISAPSYAQISDAASNQIAAVIAFKKTFRPG